MAGGTDAHFVRTLHPALARSGHGWLQLFFLMPARPTCYKSPSLCGETLPRKSLRSLHHPRFDSSSIAWVMQKTPLFFWCSPGFRPVHSSFVGYRLNCGRGLRWIAFFGFVLAAARFRRYWVLSVAACRPF